MSTDNGNSTNWIKEEKGHGSIFHGSPIKGESTQNLCGRFGSKRLNPWNSAAQSGLVGSYYGSKKDFQKSARQDMADSHDLASGLWPYQHSDNVYWEHEKGLQTYDRRKTAQGSWTNNFLHSILAQAQ